MAKKNKEAFRASAQRVAQKNKKSVIAYPKRGESSKDAVKRVSKAHPGKNVVAGPRPPQSK